MLQGNELEDYEHASTADEEDVHGDGDDTQALPPRTTDSGDESNSIDLLELIKPLATLQLSGVRSDEGDAAQTIALETIIVERIRAWLVRFRLRRGLEKARQWKERRDIFKEPYAVPGPKQKIHFLSLPANIRNQIFSMVIEAIPLQKMLFDRAHRSGKTRYIPIVCNDFGEQGRRYLWHRALPWALIAVCGSMRAEVLGVFWEGHLPHCWAGWRAWSVPRSFGERPCLTGSSETTSRTSSSSDGSQDMSKNGGLRVVPRFLAFDGRQCSIVITLDECESEAGLPLQIPPRHDHISHFQRGARLAVRIITTAFPSRDADLEGLSSILLRILELMFLSKIPTASSLDFASDSSLDRKLRTLFSICCQVDQALAASEMSDFGTCVVRRHPFVRCSRS